jgi:hypothetical protein
MFKPHANKPFPLALFENSRIKPSHIFTWWALCNSLESDRTGWITISRPDLQDLINREVPGRNTNPVILLEVLQDLGFIELKRFRKDPYARNTTTEMQIRICTGAWKLTLTRKTQSQTPERRAYYKERYRLKRLELTIHNDYIA